MRRLVMMVACLIARQAEAGPVVLIDAGDANVTLNEDTELRPLEAGDEPPGRLCRAPCNAPIPGGRRYVIDGPGIMRSEPFDLPSSGSLRLAVDPGSMPLRHAGRELELLGGVVTVFGGGVLLADPRAADHQQLALGLVIGGATAIVAGALLVAHTHTTVAIYDRGGTHVALDARRGAITF